MNKYKVFQKTGSQDVTLREIVRGQTETARMHKPGYCRKMRRTKSKHTRSTSH